jgi:CRISPR-associated protein Csb2
VHRDGEWGPCEADEIALRWLEENPPSDVRIPEMRVAPVEAVAFRDDGTIRKSRTTKMIRKLPKQDSVVAVNGPFVWSWRETPPRPVADAVRELCADVPHLGPAESPVVLTVTEDDEATHTHEYVPKAGLFAGGAGVHITIPVRGRLDELVGAHRAERTGKVGNDRAGSDERAASPVPPRRSVRVGWYREVVARNGEIPWPDVLLVPLDRQIAERDRVRVAVAAHKALIKILGPDSPPILTGSYPTGIPRPANRVALHVLDQDYPVDLPGQARSALAVLLPRGAEAAELDSVYRAVARLRELRPARGRDGKRAAAVSVAGGVEVVAGDRLWHEPEAGTVRLWRASPPAVPDTRGRKGWTFTHAVLLSLGFVWQGPEQSVLPTPEGRGEARDNALVEAVNAAGAVVLNTSPVRSSHVQDYAHRVHPNAVVRPYRVSLALGDLAGPRTVQAIGQCRHLGGGLLIPDDRDEGALIEGWPS